MGKDGGEMMTAQLVKKTIFSEDFRKLIARSGEPAAVRKLREEAFVFFEENGFPTPRHEDWKYTNVSSVASGEWRVDSAGGSINDVENALLRKFRFERNGFTALNQAFANISIVRIPKETVVDAPFEITSAGNEGTATFPHVIIVAEAGSKATLVESYSSSTKSFTNAAVQIFVEDNANLTHYRVQKESVEAFHYGVTEASLGRGSVYNSTNINLGGAISRHDIELKFTAEGSEAWVDGLYMIQGTQHSDTHSIIDHAVPNCTSHQNYKGVLNNSARGVFNGKVFVRENAHGTDAHQSNKNLLLSNDARVDTKPQLEIFNDDVKCSHGATVGQLEEEELFYLLTRGLPETLSRNLLTYGFAEEIINKIGIKKIKAELDNAVLHRLSTVL
ncbi:MAG TPA: Fe-S cluster assembly protein SufD [Pyrinomonadaceae bacterium]|nr:Fe-S cluster assembly protein SufD [Pyrinomonadaceae bacterium]